MRRRYRGSSSRRNPRIGKRRRTKETLRSSLAICPSSDSEDYIPSSDFSFDSDDEISCRPSKGKAAVKEIDGDDSSIDTDDLDSTDVGVSYRRRKRTKGRSGKKKEKWTASTDGVNEDKELKEIKFDILREDANNDNPLREDANNDNPSPFWQSKKKRKKKATKDKRHGGPLIWEVLEEENEKWIDEHETDGLDFEGQGHILQDQLEPPADIIMPLLRFQKEWLFWALKQEESPLRGGVLADEMGMGKTIQAISLVLASRAFRPAEDGGRDHSPSSPALPEIKGTLVVCPLVAVTQWESEIERFTAKGSTKVLVYHGAKRGKGIEQFSEYDFVLTTYSIVEVDYRKNNMPPKERCKWCGKLLYPKKMDIHLKYFCGPSAIKTEKQSKQVKRKKKLEGNVDNLKKKSGGLEEEEGDGVSDLDAGKGKGTAKGKKQGWSPKKVRGSPSANSTAGGDRSSPKKSALHSVKWERIILDEAHYIKDRRCNTARAILTLESSYKWALSGTPLQNRVGELYSLIRFLQISPYSYYFCKDCDCKTLDYSSTTVCPHCTHSASRHFCWWNRYIAKPIQKRGYVDEGRRAMILLRDKLLKSIVLRRTKKGRAADLALPPIIVTLRRDTLDNKEEDFYEALYTRSQAQFNTYVNTGTLMNNYAHIFDLLTRLRQAVDHPYLVIYSKTASVPGGSKSENVEQGDCGICHDLAEDPVVTSCEHVFCKACLLDYSAELGQVSCPSCPRPLTVDFMKKANVEEQNPATTVRGFKHSSILNKIQLEDFQTSTKIEALREEIRFMVEKDGSAKGIVFSQFTSFLDLINYSLMKSGIRCVQLVGSMTMTARDDAIQKFRDDPDCKIFLMSLKAGGVALNLTVASHVFLMDPWWNPAVERQAQDRIHRIGQYKPIRIVRFVIENTIEERILNLQKKKELVFEGTVGHSSQALGRLTEADLRFLFHS